MVRTKLFGILGLACAPRDRDRLEAHRPCPLNTEMSEPPDAEHGYEVARHGRRPPQRVVRGHTRAAHRAGLDKVTGHQGRGPVPSRARRPIPRSRRDTPGSAPAADALHELALAARHALIAVAAEPADRDPLTVGEVLDALPEFGDRARCSWPGVTGHVMSGNPPWTIPWSVPHTPQAATVMRTWPRGGDVVSMSSRVNSAPQKQPEWPCGWAYPTLITTPAAGKPRFGVSEAGRSDRYLGAL